MAKKATLKTVKTAAPVAKYIDSLPEERRGDAETLLALFEKTTGVPGKMWGTSIIGFGEYHYKYDSGREGDFLATGFSIRKSGPTLYIMPGYQDYTELLKKLGPHKLGKSCLYLKNLDDVNLSVIKKLIKMGLQDLKKKYPVTMK